MKLVDGTLGWVLAQLLASVAAFRGLRAPAVPDRPRHILVLKFFGLGSIQLATPFLRALRSRYPEARIGFLTFSQNAEFVTLLEDVDEVCSVRTSNLRVFALDTFRVLGWMRRVGFDFVFDLEFFSKYSTILCYLSGATVRIGYGLADRWRAALLTHSIPLRMDIHITDSFLEMGTIVGAEGPCELKPPVVTDVARAHVDGLLARHGLDSCAPLVVVNVNAGEKSLLRRWPAERFATLVESLAGRGVAVALIGSPGERAYVDAVAAATVQASPGRVFNLAGTLGVEQLAALMERSAAVVSNDSGPLHLAVALGCPTVSFFGPETPTRYGPRGGAHSVFYRGPSCSPCIEPDAASSFRCPRGQECLVSIGSDEVLARVLEIVREARVPGSDGRYRCAG